MKALGGAGMKDPTLEELIRYSITIRERLGIECIAEACVKHIIEKAEQRVVVDGVRSMIEVEVFKRTFVRTTVLALIVPRAGRYQYMFNHPQSVVRTEAQARMLDLHELSLGAGELLLLGPDYYLLHRGVVDQSSFFESFELQR